MSTSLPIFLVTGFLGSGKSTLIASLLRDPAFADSALVVNEFGEVGIDAAIVAEGQEDNVVMLDSGCICCTLTTSLEDTLETLYYKRERYEIARFARVIVETTGLADPGPIASALAGGMFIARRFHLAAIVTTVDAVHGEEQLAGFEEARDQVAIADRVVLTKIDLATQDERSRAEAAVRFIGGEVEIRPVVEGRNASEIFTQREMPVEPPVTQASEIHAVSHNDDHSHGHAADHLHAHHYVSVVIEAHEPVAREAYAAWVAHLRAIAGAGLLRAKGFLTFEGEGVHLIQGVRLLFSAPRPVAQPSAALSGRIVIIAKGVEATTLAASADILTAPAR